MQDRELVDFEALPNIVKAGVDVFGRRVMLGIFS
jgi:hypothetical protein